MSDTAIFLPHDTSAWDVIAEIYRRLPDTASRERWHVVTLGHEDDFAHVRGAAREFGFELLAEPAERPTIEVWIEVWSPLGWTLASLIRLAEDGSVRYLLQGETFESVPRRYVSRDGWRYCSL